jgi:hypothetical protein
MGFLLQPNLKNITAKWFYTQYTPKNPTIQRSNVGGSINYLRLFKPDVFFDFAIDLYNFVLYQSRFAYGFNARIEPVHTRDYYEPRTYDFTTFLLWPRNFSFGGFYSTDYRKKFAIDQRINYRIFDAEGRSSLNLDFLPRIRFSDKISLFGNIRMAFIKNEPGFVEKTLDPNPIAGIEDGDILMGSRDRFIFDNSFSFKYTFTNAMGITLRIRHYWDNVKHGQFGKLQEDGRLEYLAYSGKDNMNQPFFDRNVNIFNIDLQYSWRFAPGSDLIFVWKNEIFNNDDHYNRTYFENLGSLLNTSQGNSFSIRMLYYLDYLSVFSGK